MGYFYLGNTDGDKVESDTAPEKLIQLQGSGKTKTIINTTVVMLIQSGQIKPQVTKKFHLSLNWQSLDSKLTSFIYCLYQFFGEEQKNEVLAVVHRLEKSKASKRVIRYKQIVLLLELIWANIQIKFDDIWLPRKNQRVDK